MPAAVIAISAGADEQAGYTEVRTEVQLQRRRGQIIGLIVIPDVS